MSLYDSEFTPAAVVASMDEDRLRHEYAKAWAYLDELGAPRTDHPPDPRGLVQVDERGAALLTLRGRIARLDAAKDTSGTGSK